MKQIALGVLAAAGFAAATPAMAVTVTTGPVNTPTFGVPSGFAAGAYYEDFSDGIAQNFSGLAASGNVKSSSNGTAWARPTNNADPVTGNTNFLTTSGSTSTPVTLNLGGFNRISFYWGSIDAYNRITFLGLGTSFTGDQFFMAGDNAEDSKMVTFQFTAAEAAQITGVQFLSTNNAFEIDNLTVGSAVPEPSSWAMMMVGVGLVGGSLRRRAKGSVKALAAA